ncbi:MAG: hypothetical protein ACLFNZ_02245 [Spirochaetaceae bacterium]
MEQKRGLFFVLPSMVLMLFFSPALLFSADISVSELEFISRGGWSDEADSVVIATRGMSEMTISGGYKFGGSIALGFESGDLSYAGEEAPDIEDEKYDDGAGGYEQEAYLEDLSFYLDKQTSLDFLGAQVTYRDLGGENTELSYFVGLADRLVSGEDFPEHFGTLPFSTAYQGYYYFPQNAYRGLHRIKGTGLRVSTGFGSEQHRSSFYFYQDGNSNLDPGTYSGDYRGQFSFEDLQLEYFAGTTFPEGDYGLYRTGVLLYYSPSERGDFFAQVGIPRWQPLERLTIEHFYFLFEPRVHFDPLSVILTLFWRPEYYSMAQTGDSGKADINANFRVGDPFEDRITGGVETNLKMDTENISQDMQLSASPYVKALAGGVIWNFSLHFNILPYDLSSLVEGSIGIKAEF